MKTNSTDAGHWSPVTAHAFGAVVAACLAMVSWPGYAQNYPVKLVRLIVPLAPGGPSDILARTMAQKMTEGFMQTVLVDNRTGAGGTIGTDIAAKSPADGYTILLIAVATYTINANLYKKLPFDPRKDLLPVSVLAGAPLILTVHPALPVKSMKELIALARARPKDLNYGSGGSGTGPQMYMELLKLRTGMSVTHVPYKGTGQAMPDLIAGHVQVALFNMIASLPAVQSGKLKAIAVTGPKRSARLPDTPSFTEAGVAGFEEYGGHMIMAPAGVPGDIVARLHKELMRVLQSPDVKSRLEQEGADIIGNTPEQAAQLVRGDMDKWAEVIRKTGMKVE
ncbi:MAG TPA: tripartite tricarboxylate transporter substrate binding protein [Burkholderiales bacterium]|nr:tripartite tricarboxylate transporter substrate binding protein [Burkholderiales bacterium]